MPKKFSRKKRFRDTVELFSSPSGIRAVGSPVKVRILGLLRTSTMPFDEIVADSGKAKSTVSVHLTDLERLGIIGSRTDPADARRKLFFIRSGYLGGASDGERIVPGGPGTGDARVVTRESEPAEFYRLMFRSIRVTLLREGINIDPILRTAGENVGRAISDAVSGPDLGSLLSNLSQFWAHHRLGTITVDGLSPLVLTVTDCFECADLPAIGRPACAFESGILAAVFSGYFGGEPDIRETACYAMGDWCCRFVIGNRERRTEPGLRNTGHLRTRDP